MMKTNCPNCGAPFDPNEYKCPYCGTVYFDLGCIDLKDRKPMYIRFKTNYGYIVQKCVPINAEMEITRESSDVTSNAGLLRRIYKNPTATTRLELQGIAMESGELFSVYI